MQRNYGKILFDFINSYGPMFGSNFCIIDNTGKLSKGKHYRVFLKGGIAFDISKELGEREFEYDFVSVWDGPFFAENTPQHTLAALIMMGHSFKDKV